MDKLGYYPNVKTSSGFERKDLNLKSSLPNYVSFDDACKLHNNTIIRLSKAFCLKTMLGVNADFKPNDTMLNLKLHIAHSNKLVDKVKLQKDNESELNIKCQEYLVTFTKYVE